MTIPQAIQRFLQQTPPRGAAFVGFSGGIDSTALLVALVTAGVEVTAVHFQHGIRGQEAEDDARWCQNFCKTRNIAFRRINLNVPAQKRTGETLEEAARRLRLEQWTRLATNASVYLAHHGDDVLEELFLRLARGANASGLTSLRPVRTIRGVTFLRPFLDLTKDQLQDYIEAQDIRDWRLDSTNTQNDYRRNAVRNRLLPLLRTIFNTEAGFRQAIWALRQDANHLETEAQNLAARPLKRREWQQLSPALLPRVFRIWRQEQDGVDAPPPRNFIVALQNALDYHSHNTHTLQLDPRHQITVAPDGLHWETLEETSPFSYAWDWQRQPAIVIPQAHLKLTANPPHCLPNSVSERFNRAELPQVLTIRSWQPGDRMIPFGHHSPKKLQDILTDAHLTHRQKQRTAILCAQQTIIWIPCVRRAEFARTEPHQETILISAQPWQEAGEATS